MVRCGQLSIGRARLALDLATGYGLDKLRGDLERSVFLLGDTATATASLCSARRELIPAPSQQGRWPRNATLRRWPGRKRLHHGPVAGLVLDLAAGRARDGSSQLAQRRA